MQQTRATRKLQPEIQKIRKHYASDRLAQTQAIRELYQANGIRTSSTLLALLLQAPIYSGLYFALNMIFQASSVTALNHILYSFIPHMTALPNLNLMWFIILNASWHLSLGLPDPTPILPLLAGLLTFVQTRLAQPIAVTETRESIQHISQSIQWLLLLIPVIITVVITWRFAAGIALYRIVSLLLNITQQYIISLWRGPRLKAGMAKEVNGLIRRDTSHMHVRSSRYTPRNRRQGKSHSPRRRK